MGFSAAMFADSGHGGGRGVNCDGELVQIRR